jgi:hypothetical protein
MTVLSMLFKTKGEIGHVALLSLRRSRLRGELISELSEEARTDAVRSEDQLVCNGRIY